MRLPLFLMGILIAMCVVFVAVIATEEIPDGHGFTHPELNPHLEDHPEAAVAMQKGGPGWERHERILWLGLIFGLLEIVFFVACLCMGASRMGELPAKVKWPMLGGLIAFMASFIALVFAYRGYANDETPALFLAFPAPTAFMLYAIWPVPLFFMFFFIMIYDRWILTPEDLEKFKKIVEEKRRRENRNA